MSGAFLLGIFDPLLNWLRSLNPTIKTIILLVALVLTFLCVAKCINVGKNHAERPIKWLMLGLAIICFGIAALMAFV